MIVRCETCPIQDFCPTIGTTACPLLKLLKEDVKERSGKARNKDGHNKR